MKTLPQTRKSILGGIEMILTLSAVLGAIALFKEIPRLEGMLAPVVSGVGAKGAAIEASPGVSQLQLTASKKRDCSWRAVQCFYGDRDGLSVPVACEFTDPPKLRGVGELEWEGFEIALQPLLLDNAYSDVLHRCHPFWLTRSRFWEASDE